MRPSVFIRSYNSEKLLKNNSSCSWFTYDSHIFNIIVISGYRYALTSIIPFSINPLFIVFGAITFANISGQQMQWSTNPLHTGNFMIRYPLAYFIANMSSRKLLRSKPWGRFTAVVLPISSDYVVPDVMLVCLHANALSSFSITIYSFFKTAFKSAMAIIENNNKLGVIKNSNDNK